MRVEFEVDKLPLITPSMLHTHLSQGTGTIGVFGAAVPRSSVTSNSCNNVKGTAKISICVPLVRRTVLEWYFMDVVLILSFSIVIVLHIKCRKKFLLSFVLTDVGFRK